MAFLIFVSDPMDFVLCCIPGLAILSFHSIGRTQTQCELPHPSLSTQFGPGLEGHFCNHSGAQPHLAMLLRLSAREVH